MSLILRKHLTLMPLRFESLATYNAEVNRGIVHTPEWKAQMADLQAEYDAWLEARRG